MKRRLATGTEFRLPPRAMTRERMRCYVDIQDTVAHDDGHIHTQPSTIHDDDYARKQGLPGVIADRTVGTNWILGLLIDIFGVDAASRSRLRTRCVAPVYEDQVLIACARVASVLGTPVDETIYLLDVWCEDATGRKVTVGEATVHASDR